MRNHKTLLILPGLILVGGLVFWSLRPPGAPLPSALPAPGTAPIPSPRPNPIPDLASAPVPASSASLHHPEDVAPLSPSPTAESAPLAEARPAVDPAIDQIVDQLVSPQLGFLQKQALFGQLRNTGQIAQVVAALEERQAADPTSAEIPTQLGMAYLIAISTNPDVREQGIGGMKADLSFDAALKLDPTNWEANFMKASALSHWPDSMKMGPQVIERFTNLIEQQETQPSRPEFMQTYVLLGDQYQKSGQTEEARQIWARGLNFFPGSQTLAQKLNPAP